MIEDLHNKDFFYKENDIFIKHFCKHIKNILELNKEIELSQMLLTFYQKVYDNNQTSITRDMFDLDLYGYGYIENYGYYTITDGSNGYYIVICHGEDVNAAFVNIVQSMIDRKAKQEIKKNRKEIKQKYKRRLGGRKNYQALYFTNYSLSQWNKYYEGNIPNALIDMYIKKLDYIDNPTLKCYQAGKIRTLKKRKED